MVKMKNKTEVWHGSASLLVEDVGKCKCKVGENGHIHNLFRGLSIEVQAGLFQDIYLG